MRLSEMVMHDSWGNLSLFTKKTKMAKEIVDVFALPPSISAVIPSFHNLLMGLTPMEMQQMFPWHPSGPCDPFSSPFFFFEWHPVLFHLFLFTVSYDAWPCWVSDPLYSECPLNHRIKNKQSRPSHPSRSWQDVFEQKPTSKPLFLFTYFCCDAWGCIYTWPRFI